MKLMKNLLFAFLLSVVCVAIANAEDIIYLKDGSVVHGTIIKRFPETGSIKVRKHSGAEVVYKKKQVLRVEHVSESHSTTMSEAPKRHHHHEEMENGGVIEGLNISGKPGYFISDTAKVLDQGQIAGAAHATFDTSGSALQIPVGVSYGITDKITVNVNTSFFTAGGASGIYYLNFGGKYGFKNVADGLDIAAGLDFSVGPISNSIYGYSSFAFDPYGVATYTFKDGFQLNGKLGLYVSTYTATYTSPFPPYTTSSASFSYSDFQLDLGAAYPFDPNLSGFAELATNGTIGAAGVGGTPILVGIRTGHDVQLQAFGGLDLGGGTGLFLGAGVALFSK